eukprot:s326_g14.t2
MTSDARLCGELRGSHLDVPAVLQSQEVREQRGTSPGTESRLRWDSKIDIEVDHAAQKLMTVSCTAKVAEAVVAALTDAGSRLQRCSTACILPKESRSLAACLKQEDEVTADACSNLGAVLISLASAMSQSLLLPLESFHRGASADHVRKKAALDGLRERELSCSNSVTESLQKRDRARVGLQSAMREQEKTQKKAGEKKKGLARFTRGDGEKDIAAAEMKVQKAASAQTASIEELASRTEEANEARLLRESATKEVDLLLSYIETVRTRLLSRCLNSCALAYGEAAKNLRKSAADLQSQVSFLRQSQSTRPEMPASGSDGHESSLPSWAVEALKVSKKRPSTIEVQEEALSREDKHPESESPFTTPLPLRRSSISHAISPANGNGLTSSQGAGCPGPAGFQDFLKGRSETSPAILTSHTFPLASPTCEDPRQRRDSSQFPFED